MSQENVYQFIDLPRVDPPKIPLGTRKTAFVEIYQAFTDTQAQSQADRCLVRISHPALVTSTHTCKQVHSC